MSYRLAQTQEAAKILAAVATDYEMEYGGVCRHLEDARNSAMKAVRQIREEEYEAAGLQRPVAGVVEDTG